MANCGAEMWQMLYCGEGIWRNRIFLLAARSVYHLVFLLRSGNTANCSSLYVKKNKVEVGIYGNEGKLRKHAGRWAIK